MKAQEVEILLIEDNPYEAELAIRNLKKHKLANKLVHLDDGEDALDFIFAKGKFERSTDEVFNPKVILLDLKLPKMNGQYILKQIREHNQTKNIPVVILTSSNEEPDIKECYELGANSYIVKPVNFQDFSKVIADLGMYWMLLNKPAIKH